MRNNNWYVITGGPGSGKTTTINLLKERGFNVAEEVARAYYESQMALGITNEQIRSNPQKLQDGIAKELIELEQRLNPEDRIFLDRAIPDNLAYYDFYNLQVPEFLKEAYDECSYKTVFYLDQVSFAIDNVRTETEEETRKLSKLTHASYKRKNIETINVPAMDRDVRVDFILNHIKNTT